MKNEVAVFSNNDGNYSWFDNPVWGVDLKREEVVNIFDYADMIGHHACKRSAIAKGAVFARWKLYRMLLLL